jgi:dihydrofolate reductase
MLISIVTAVADNGVIGKDGQLPWRLPDELKRFKEITMGKPIIMGRKTYESLGRPLPGRMNVVVSREYVPDCNECAVAPSLDAALELARATGAKEACVIGGAQLYAAALPRAEVLYITRVHGNVEGDTYLPEIPLEEFQLTDSTQHPADEKHAYSFTMQQWMRP